MRPLPRPQVRSRSSKSTITACRRSLPPSIGPTGRTTSIPRSHAGGAALESRRTDSAHDSQRAIAQSDPSWHTCRAQHVVYCGTVYNGSGAFRGTGPDGGRPREIHVLRRGDVRNLGPLVGPGTVPVDSRASPGGSICRKRATKAIAAWRWPAGSPIGAIRSRGGRSPIAFGSIISAGESSTRPATSAAWDSFPAHPELLDWLAAELRDHSLDGGRSLKALHRMIVTSAAYRQVSTSNDAGAAKDAGNTLLWRMNRRRLDAESIRDSVLSACGRLRDRMYGPSFRAFVIEKPEHSPHYEYDEADPGRSPHAPSHRLPLSRPLAARSVHADARLCRPLANRRKAG